ncbi:FecR domain-containing protein [Comamonas antarctica]|uniref:FecR family protein n=1 Tax=Comamonas antarctica TaxID=2743470 RepID=UPI0028EC50E2|nr:FecR domain-containing protein [Comamonas antarctica]
MGFSEPARKKVEEALLLVGRMHRADPDSAMAAAQELQRWRAGTAECRAALETAERLWASTDGSFLQSSVPQPQAHDHRRARRNTVGLLGLGGVAAMLWAGGRWYWQQPVYELALQTGHAQQRDMRLPDDSEISLAPHTRIRIVMYRDRREVRLDQGQVRFRVAQDIGRPFTVATEWGRVRVLGTVFSVGARAGRMRVEVAEGRVAVWPLDRTRAAAYLEATPPVNLTAGYAIEADQSGQVHSMQVAADSVAAWRNGWLVFHNTPLDQVLAQWNDYLSRPLLLGSHPRLQQLQLSGSFPIRQPQAFLAGLPDMLPVRIQRNATGDVTVELR